MLELTEENYYSPEADEEYMSVHQYLSFAGHLGIHGCEMKALAKLAGEWTDPTTDAMLVGSYVDSYFEGTLPKFKAEHKEIFTQKGELKAQYKRAEKMIARCEQDDFFKVFMSGKKQEIMTGYWNGCDWKIKMDSYIPGEAIVDLKTTANIHQTWNVPDYGVCTFVEYWGYLLQLALYQKIVEINTGEKLECYIAAVTKEDVPEIEIISVSQTDLDDALSEIAANLPSVLAVKNGDIEATRCEKCDFCKTTRKLTKATYFRDLING